MGVARCTTGRRATAAIALFHRGARFGTEADPVARARERTLGIAQIESPEAVEAVEEIAAVDGHRRALRRPVRPVVLDGELPEFDDPEFRAAIERVVAAAEAAGKTAGIFLTAIDQVAPALADGFRMIAIGSDGGFMMQAAAQTLAEAAKLA